MDQLNLAPHLLGLVQQAREVGVCRDAHPHRERVQNSSVQVRKVLVVVIPLLVPWGLSVEVIMTVVTMVVLIQWWWWWWRRNAHLAAPPT